MDEDGAGPPSYDWRNPEQYAGLNEVSPERIAWEFLRRNPDYRRDARQAEPVILHKRPYGLEITAPTQPDARRWGVLFFRPSDGAGFSGLLGCRRQSGCASRR